MVKSKADLKKTVQKVQQNPAKYAKNVSITKLVQLLKDLSHYYYNTGESLLDDVMYDILRDTLKERDPSNKFLTVVGAPISKDKVDLPFPMASLDKIKPDTGALTSWMKQYTGPYVLSDKLDGVSALLYKKNDEFQLFTRGDGLKGQNISHLIKNVFPNNVNWDAIPDQAAIRGELIISKKNFDKFGGKYKNARNTVAGIVNAKHPKKDVVKQTEFIGYAVVNPELKQSEQMKKIQEWGIPVVTYKNSKTLSNDMLSKYLVKRREGGEYEVDGIVVIDSGKSYTVKNMNPKHGFAFKMVLTDQVAETAVIDVEWEVSMHGYLKPRIQVQPVQLVGVTVEYATAHNARYVVDNKLGPGAVVKLVRSGDVIPYIKEVIKPAAKARLPDIPHKWNKSNVDLVVKDIHGQAADNIIIKKLTHFFSTLGVKYFGEGIVTKLVEAGFKDVFSIVEASVQELAEADGVGEKMLTKIKANLDAAFKRVKLEQLMAASLAFGRGFGKRRSKTVIDAYPTMMSENWDRKTAYSKAIVLPGFEDITADQFADGFEDFKQFFKKLSAIVDLQRLCSVPVKKNSKKQVLKDEKIVFTGFRDKELEETVAELGGKVSSGVSSATTILVYLPGGETSSKYVKAENLNINRMTKTEFLKKYIG